MRSSGARTVSAWKLDHPGIQSVFGPDDFDGNRNPQRSVYRLKDTAHTAVADLLDDGVSVGEDIPGREALPILVHEFSRET
jgi:hypothetical protein